jgi:hypothetical protein
MIGRTTFRDQPTGAQVRFQRSRCSRIASMSTHEAPVTSRIRMPRNHSCQRPVVDDQSSGWDRSGGGSRAATAVQTASTTSGRNARMMPGTSTMRRYVGSTRHRNRTTPPTGGWSASAAIRSTSLAVQVQANSSIRSSRMSDRQKLTPPQTTMWPSPPRLSLSISSVVSPAAMVSVGVHDAGELVIGRRQGSGHAVVGGASHDVRVRALVDASSAPCPLGRRAGRSRTANTRIGLFSDASERRGRMIDRLRRLRPRPRAGLR